MPMNAYPQDGIFHARFWRFGMWEDVYVDDFLPYDSEKNVWWGATSSTSNSEFWVSFLEKAFAK